MKQWVLQLAAVGAASALGTGCGSPPCTQSGIACDWINHAHVAGNNGDHKALRDSYLYNPLGVKFAPDGTPFVIDYNNHRIRKVLNGTLKTAIGNWVGDGDPEMADLTPQGADPLQCNLNHPTNISFQPDGSFIVDAWHDHKFRLLNAADDTEWVIAGRGYAYTGDGGPFSKALLNQPNAGLLGPDGAFYFVDQRNEVIRKVDPPASKNGVLDPSQTIHTIIGNGKEGYAGDGGDPLQAQLNFETGSSPLPSGWLALDQQGRLYISDSLNNRVRRVDFQANTIETIAGTGEAKFSGDGGPATSAGLNNPHTLNWGPDGRLYIADTGNHAIRALDVNTGIITTVAGTGKAGVGQERQTATTMELNTPFSVDFDAQGNMYISDTLNNRIVEVTR